jgi:glycosyltransferase involved in cell wall biosynthesis
MKVLCVTGISDRPEAETFIGLKKLGVDIQVACPSSAPQCQRLAQAGIPVTDLKLKGRVDRVGIGQIRRLIVEKEIDLLHLFNNKAVSNGILAATRLPVKIIAYRGIVANVSYLNPASWMTYLHPRVDRIVCVAEAVRRHFLSLKCLWLRVPARKPITIYKGHSLDWYREAPADLRQFGIPDNAFVVGATASARPRKGIRVLVEAMRHLPDEFPIHLLLIGHMNDAGLRRQIRASPMQSRIHVAGYRPDAPVLQAACSVVVLPVLRKEGLPKVVIEAMAYGIPPIVTDSGGSPELVEDGVSGLVVAPGDARAIAKAIACLVRDPALRTTMGKRARERIATHFRIEDTIQQTLGLYTDTLT